MKSVEVSKIRSYIVIAALCLLSAGVGYNLGVRGTTVGISPDKRVVVNQQQPAGVNVDFSLFWDVWQRLNTSYIDHANLDAQKMVYGAIGGMVSAIGDPYTLFLPPHDNTDFKDNLSGQFTGIGAQLDMKDGNVIIQTPLKGNPAEKAGIRPGDYILKVDGVSTAGWTVAQAVLKIRGPKGTTVKLQILHETDTKPIDISIVRDTITVSTVDTWIKELSDIPEIAGTPSSAALAGKSGKVAYIKLSQFGDHTNDEMAAGVLQVETAYASDHSIKGLVFDLRNNPGGYLESAVHIASEFIPSGTIVSQVNSDGSKQNYPVDHKGQLLTIPMVVLINKGSASAAEIVSGALKDYKRATLVGEVSFGKGSVQTPEDLPDGSGLHITTGKWLLPSGNWINKIGITPNIIIPSDSVTATMDAQLGKAIEVLFK
ncbi:MAG TPA: S41 family peptidase [Patescibacteria group bacterium]|nr:S41 family peptidase [Patescibacteria group bacterium]